MSPVRFSIIYHGDLLALPVCRLSDELWRRGEFKMMIVGVITEYSAREADLYMGMFLI